MRNPKQSIVKRADKSEGHEYQATCMIINSPRTTLYVLNLEDMGQYWQDKSFLYISSILGNFIVFGPIIIII